MVESEVVLEFGGYDFQVTHAIMEKVYGLPEPEFVKIVARFDEGDGLIKTFVGQIAGVVDDLRPF